MRSVALFPNGATVATGDASREVPRVVGAQQFSLVYCGATRVFPSTLKPPRAV